MKGDDELVFGGDKDEEEEEEEEEEINDGAPIY